jgi:hypothetical protein
VSRSPDTLGEVFRRRREAARARDALRKGAVRRVVEPDPAPPPLPHPDLTQLEAEARYHRDRLALYRGRVLSAKETSPQQLRRLERAAATADERLRHARGA